MNLKFLIVKIDFFSFSQRELSVTRHFIRSSGDNTEHIKLTLKFTYHKARETIKLEDYYPNIYDEGGVLYDY